MLHIFYCNFYEEKKRDTTSRRHVRKLIGLGSNNSEFFPARSKISKKSQARQRSTRVNQIGLTLDKQIAVAFDRRLVNKQVRARSGFPNECTPKNNSIPVRQATAVVQGFLLRREIAVTFGGISGGRPHFLWQTFGSSRAFHLITHALYCSYCPHDC